MSSGPAPLTRDQFAGEPAPDLEAALRRIKSLLSQPEMTDARSSQLESVETFGVFEGVPPKIELLPDGRKARLLAPIAFTRPDGSHWPVPAGAELDGASIPRPFWALIGGPFEGRYRDASIVHDHYCVVQTRSWRDTHRMFYEAMRAAGVGAAKARVMYYAVFRFGPRWPSGLESAEADTSPAILSDGSAAVIESDAEAIVVHNLGLHEIEELAEARNREAGEDVELESTAAPDAATLLRARRLVVVGGSGSADDLEVVASRAGFLPDYVMKRFEQKGVRIVACRDSVTNFETDLRGVTPRGWERTGKTWDDVPGAYFPDRKRVIIATMAENGGRVVPTKASRLHGSVDLLVHECLHGFDYICGHEVLGDPGFTRARDVDFDKLSTYERQPGQAGLEETFAESGARFIVEPAVMAGDWRALHDYWETPSHESLESAGPIPESTTGPEAPIGTAEIGDDGSILLELRATDASGAIGHANIAVGHADPSYPDLKTQLFGNAEGLEGTAGKVLVWP